MSALSSEHTSVTPRTFEHPIVALASAPGAGAIAVVRMSGTGCHDILGRCFRPGSGGDTPPERVMTWGRMVDPDDGSVVDEVMAAVFRGPRSYTGEDSVEIFCHGGPFVVRRVIDTLLRLGCHAADPGEFSRRAFMNGKMDLTAIEGVNDLIRASSEQQYRAARHLVTGGLSRAVSRLRDELVAAMVFLEAQIDFPDEGDTASLDVSRARERVDAVAASVRRLERSYSSGRVASQGLSVAFYGAPNVGKSTLLNTLLGHARAIVTDIAGTTRDYIEEPCLMRGRLTRLIDMAGIRENPERVEHIGVAHAEDWARDADVTLLMADPEASRMDLDRLEAKARERGDRPVVRVLTKSDAGDPEWADASWIKISCLEEAGLDSLRDRLASLVDSFVGGLNDGDSFITTTRQLHAVRRAEESLERFYAASDEGQREECLAFELQEAARALAAIVGEISNDDVLDALFGTFCIGK